MAGGSTIVYAFNRVVSRQYEYKSVWTSLTDKRVSALCVKAINVINTL